MTNLDSILESRDITLLTKVHLVKAMIFPVVMYGCETIKKAEYWRIVGGDSWESLVEQEQTLVNPKGNLNIQKTKIMASGPITSLEIDGETVETVLALFWGAPKSLQMVIAAMKLKDASSLEEKLWPT